METGISRQCANHPLERAVDYCQKCGNAICGACLIQSDAGDVYCVSCIGRDVPRSAASASASPTATRPAAKDDTGVLVGALLLGVFGPCGCGLPGVIGMYLGLRSLGRMERGEIGPKGKWLAWTSAILGLLNLLAMIAGLLFLAVEGGRIF